MSASPAGRPLASVFQIYAPSTVYAIGLGAMSPSVATAALHFGAGPALAAAAVVLIGLGGLVTNGPAALLTARVGERRTIIASACLGTLGAALAWAATAGAHVTPARMWGLGEARSAGLGLALLLLAVLLVGAAGAGFNLARQSYLAVAVAPTHRARAMAALGGTMRIGSLVGPFLGAAVQLWLGVAGAFATATAAMAVGVALRFAIDELDADGDARSRPASGAGGPTLRSVARDRARLLGTVGACVVALSAARASRNAVLPLWAAHVGLSPAGTSAVMGLAALVDVAMFYPSGWLMDRFGRRAVAVPCLGVMTLGFALVPLTHAAPGFVAAALLVGLGNGFGAGIVMTLGADYAPEDARAQFLGVWRFVSDLGMVTGPLVVAAVTSAASLAAGVGVLAALTAAGTVGFRALLPPGPGSVMRERAG